MKNKFTKSAYRPLPDCLTIKASNIDGLGLCATRNIDAGTVLGITHHYINSNTLRTPLGGFINHSDTPNCYITVTQHENTLHTVMPIRKGHELTVYYRLELSND
tara:strand:- start:190 stop:501 length:312 start_codon:yes stop_codon:yes gene_type:complete